MPRALLPGFPLGHPLGRPAQREQQLAVLRECLHLLASATEAGTVAQGNVPY